jgi:hypothetical protein
MEHQMFSAREVGTVGLIALLVVLLALNARYLVQSVNVLLKRKTFEEQPPILPGPIGLVIIGSLMLAICVVEGLLSGGPWYKALLPLGRGAEFWKSSPFLVLGYLFVLAGLVSYFRGGSSNRD